MNIGLCIRIVGLLLMLFSLGTLPSMVLGWVQEDGTAEVFGQAFAATAISGVVLSLLTQRVNTELQIRDGFLVTAAFWIVLSLYGSLPFLLSDAIQVSVFDAVFESVSGLTTTGATVLAGLDKLPQSILLYRQLLQWLGGIGIIVLAVAVLPMLGIGGVQLYRAESTGPAKDSKLTPRITSTAKALFSIYLGLTVACAAAYYLAGMSAFDAISHAFSTIAIGGFSTHDASMGYFQSDVILLIACLFMLISAVNFGLHFVAFSKRNPGIYRFDSETKFFSGVLLISSIVTCITLVAMGTLSARQGYYSRVIPNRIDCDDHWLCQRSLRRVAFLPTDISDHAQCDGRLRGFHRRRHESHAHLAYLSPGLEGTPTTAPPQCGDSVKARSPKSASGGSQRGLEFLRGLHVFIVHFSAVYAGNWLGLSICRQRGYRRDQ